MLLNEDQTSTLTQFSPCFPAFYFGALMSLSAESLLKEIRPSCDFDFRGNQDAI